jgi:circadian clock protein KaiB
MCSARDQTGMTISAENAGARFEAVLASGTPERYVFRLYVSGATPRSTRAIANIKKICNDKIVDRYELEVIDIYQQPVLAKNEQIIATPTLIRHLPLPLRRFVGDLSNTQQLLLGLDLQPESDVRDD